DHTLDDNLLPSKLHPKGEFPYRPPTTNVGDLDVLPPELQQEILSQLDLRSLTVFQRVNRRATELVNSLPQYKTINTHALNALRGILSIETGKWITYKTLYEKLCTLECENYGDFGGYLYLLTYKRVCFLCFSQDRLYLPLSPRLAKRKFGLCSRTVNTLPCMKVIYGKYSPNVKNVYTPSVLVDYKSALHAGIALHGSLSAMHEYVAKMEDQKCKAHNAKQSSPTSGHPRRTLTLNPFDKQSGNPFRFVAIVHVTWFNRASQEVVQGFHCVGCEKSCRLPLHYRRKFIATSFDNHLKRFGSIQNGKH
ncbi:hypothetical protein BKA67DRAFT_501432, partial [Truncatella angustata]